MQNNPKHERDINIEEKQPKKKRKIVERKSVGELIEVARSKARTGNFLGAIKDADSALKIEPNNARGLRIGAEARAAVQKKIASQPVSMPVSSSTSSSSVSIAVETQGAPALVVRSPRPMPPLIRASAQATATSVLLSPLQSAGMFASSSSSCSSSSPARDESGLATLSEVVAIKQEAVIARSV